MKILRSTYRDNEKDQFEMEILEEGINKDGEPVYICKFLPKYQNTFEKGNKTREIRKKLVGKNNIYELKEKIIYEQIKLF